MKTKFVNFVMPMAVAALGLAGAFSTNAMNESGKDVAPVMGYKHVSGAIPCQAVQECSNSGVFDCTTPDGSQLYSLAGASNCATPLQRNIE
jgi:hypothetical protein